MPRSTVKSLQLIGTPAANDTITIVFGSCVENISDSYPSTVTVTTTAVSGDTMASLAQRLANAISSNFVLSKMPVLATASGSTLSITRDNPYTNSISISTNIASGINIVGMS